MLDALLWRVIVPHDPQAITASATLKAPERRPTGSAPTTSAATSSRACSRGPRPVLTVAPLATLLGVTGGIAVGLVAGYYRGLVDDVVSR